MDLVIYTAALDKSAAAVTSASDLTAVADIEELVLGDNPLINVEFVTAAGAYATWSGDATYTLGLALGKPTHDGGSSLSSASSFATTAHGWSGRLNLSTSGLVSELDAAEAAGRPGVWLTLQVRVTDPSGHNTTYAELAVYVRARVVAGTAPDTTADSYLTAAQTAAGYVQNRSGITSLTGGGTAALDGLATANSAQATGTVVFLSINDFPQFWKLVAGTTAEDALTIVRPDDYHATTNARIWKLLA